MKSYSSDETRAISKQLLFELIERISRFHLHLEDIRERFYPGKEYVYQYDKKLHLLNPYHGCLIKVLKASLLISKHVHHELTPINILKQLPNQIQILINLLADLHKNKLGLLPRPPEPPELKRFGRILDKHIMKLSERLTDGDDHKTEISIYVDEKISELTYAGDPLAEFKNNVFNSKIKEFNNLILSLNIDEKLLNEFSDLDKLSSYHITIPRIDANNPCRWPTLVHELAHKLMDSKFFKTSKDIETDFNNVLGRDVSTKYAPEINIKSWLTECWCDLLGVIVMGPSFWFAQNSAFLFFCKSEEFGLITKTHPPPLFRLFLINKVLHHRFSTAVFPELESTISSSKQIMEYFDLNNENGFINNSELKELALFFKIYFFDHFFIKKGDTLTVSDASLNESLTYLIKYTEGIKSDVIYKMISLLEKGFPIPSVRNISSNFMEISERASTVQECLLAAWIYRNNSFKTKSLEMHYNLSKKVDLSEEDSWQYFRDTIVKGFNEFNYSVLRSIQVGEWFHLLKGVNDFKKLCGDETGDNMPINSAGSVLADYEIFKFIKDEQILIIPLINFSEQLGSTSLDIRLGTSFQVYHPNQVGIVDLTDSDSMNNANKHSDLVDLDFLESITISPGQFILAHSMEYIKLPRSISAEVEGRSSLARLGIEVHMTAGFVDPGFQGVLTFEIFNAGPNPIKLYPGLRVAQLRFSNCSIPCKPYDKNPTAKYKGLLAHHNSLQLGASEVYGRPDHLTRTSRVFFWVFSFSACS